MESKASKKLLSTIYRQNWPPPNAKNENDENHKRNNTNTKELAGNLWKGGTTFREKNLSCKRGHRIKSTRSVVPRNKIQRPKSCMKYEKPVSAVITQERKSTKETLHTVEYVTMLSSKNYLRKMYRDQYWSKDQGDQLSIHNHEGRSVTPAKITLGLGSDAFKYYPDMGSVISRPQSRKCVLSTTSTPIYPRDSWKMLSIKSKTEHDGISLEGDKTQAQDLKTNVESDSSISSCQSNKGLFAFTSKGSWSNIPMGKSFRMQKQSTSTLASISLEGRATNHQPRGLTQTRSSSSFQSGLNGITHMNRLSSAGESLSPSPSLDSDRGKQECQNDETEQRSATADEQIYFDDEEYERTKLLIDPSIYDVKLCQSFHQMFAESGSPRQRNQSFTLSSESGVEEEEENYAESYIAESELSDSDINDDFEEEELNQEEGERRLQQVSAVFSTQSGGSFHDKDTGLGENEEDHLRESLIQEKLSGLSFMECENDSTHSSEGGDDVYQFADFFTPPFNACDTNLLSSLPPDVDWRTCVQLPQFINSLKKRLEKKLAKYPRSSAKGKRHKTITKSAVENLLHGYKDMESCMDKVINLERMQSLTVQYEKERRRHLMHVQRARSRNLKQRRPSTANESGKSSPTKQVTVQHELNRLIKPATDNKQDEGKNKQFTRSVSQSSNRRSTSYKRPWQPRCYEYSCSERIKDLKGPPVVRSLSYYKTRSCSSCRERSKKIPSSINSQSIHRPKSTIATLSNSFQLNTSSNLPLKLNVVNSLSPRKTGLDSVHGISTEDGTKAKTPREVYHFKQASVKPPNNLNTAAISAAKSIVNSVGKDYAKAEGRPPSRKKSAFLPQRVRTSSTSSRQRKRANKRDGFANTTTEISFQIVH